MFGKRNKLIFILITTILTAAFLMYVYFKKYSDTSVNDFAINNQELNEENSKSTPFIYNPPQIAKSRSYRIVLAGDSITRALGPNANKLREYLIEYYPDSEFVVYNYGYSSTNVESLPQRLTEKTEHLGESNEAILNQGFEMIIIESFGYNPLSENSIEEGLKKQEEVLEESLRLITDRKPGAAILFMTPIAPDPDNFAKGTVELTTEMRKTWVEERVRYIENFKKIAKAKNIPLIDIYTASLNPDGSINRSYVSGDNIHPSEKGIDLMAREIADFIASNKIFPE